jgi:hypothetical protein
MLQAIGKLGLFFHFGSVRPFDWEGREYSEILRDIARDESNAQSSADRNESIRNGRLAGRGLGVASQIAIGVAPAAPLLMGPVLGGAVTATLGGVGTGLGALGTAVQGVCDFIESNPS